MKKSDVFSGGRYFAAKNFNGPLQLEIEMLRHEKFENDGKSQEKPVLYFRRQQPGLVLGPTIWDEIVAVTGKDDSDDWKGCVVELYQTETLFKGTVTPCIRVRKPNAAPTKTKAAAKPAPEFDDEMPI